MLSNGPVYLMVYLPEVPHRADKPLERLSFGNASPHHPVPCFQDVLLGLISNRPGTPARPRDGSDVRGFVVKGEARRQRVGGLFSFQGRSCVLTGALRLCVR